MAAKPPCCAVINGTMRTTWCSRQNSIGPIPALEGGISNMESVCSAPTFPPFLLNKAQTIATVGIMAKTIYTTITPLPAGITREIVLETLHDALEMIDLNPVMRLIYRCLVLMLLMLLMRPKMLTGGAVHIGSHRETPHQSST